MDFDKPNDPARVYKREVSHLRLAPGEEESLVSRLDGDPKDSERVRMRLIEGHLMTVVGIAEEYAKSESHHVLDLLMAGNQALLRSLKPTHRQVKSASPTV